MDRPTVFCLAGLGLGAASFAPLTEVIGADADVVPVDLIGATVAQMADRVTERIREAGAERWLLLGHSMGGKIATVVASRALAGTAPVFGLAGIVLLASSPPAPEPMPDAQRERMLSWAATGRLDAGAARAFVDGNIGAPLPRPLDDLAIASAQASDPRAWTDWLTGGSRENWTEAVGTLDLPALVLAGSDDGPLGPEGQRTLVAPHFPRARVETLDGAGHFLHLERPEEVGRRVLGLWDGHAGRGPVVPRDVVTLLAGDRVAAVTRGALARRAVADDPSYRPKVLTSAQLATLRAIADRVVPQDGPTVDLAARVDAGLAAGETDGWRPAGLPEDAEAYAAGLDALADFAALSGPEQDDRIRDLVDGNLDPDGRFSSAELTTWFEDVRDDLVRRWVMHPATLARLGFDGFAIGGDAPRQTGFVELGIGRSEAWEPSSVTAP